MSRGPAEERARARRAAQRALERALRAAADAGVPLTDWEGAFLGSLDERLETYGRAFADPAKGDPGAALSRLQGAKLKEIGAKARGKPTRRRWIRRGPRPGGETGPGEEG